MNTLKKLFNFIRLLPVRYWKALNDPYRPAPLLFSMIFITLVVIWVGMYSVGFEGNYPGSLVIQYRIGKKIPQRCWKTLHPVYSNRSEIWFQNHQNNRVTLVGFPVVIQQVPRKNFDAEFKRAKQTLGIQYLDCKGE